jgi:hypothetical protein
MPRKPPAAKEPESIEPTAPAIVNGEIVEVPVSAVVYIPAAFSTQSEAFHVRDLFRLWKSQDNRDFIPFLFPTPDGSFAVTGFRRA